MISPGTTTNNTDIRVKYRSSCDRCQDNKVKCGQEKPECDRCVKKRLACVYSPIRAMGRPRKYQPPGSGNTSTATNSDTVPPPPPQVSAVVAASHGPTAVAAATATTVEITASVEEEEHGQFPEDMTMPGIEHSNHHHTTTGTTVLETHDIDPKRNMTTRGSISLLPVDTPTASGLPLNQYPSSSTNTQTVSSSSEGRSSTNGDASSTTGTTTNSINMNSSGRSLPPPPPSSSSSCYTSILDRSLKLEQLLLSAAGDPIGLEAALEAESDFRALKTQLFNCPGNGEDHQPLHVLPTTTTSTTIGSTTSTITTGTPKKRHVTAITGSSFILTPKPTTTSDTDANTKKSCLRSSLMEARMCLTSLMLYGERVAEVLKDAIADFQPFPGVDSCSTRCSYFGVQNYRVLRAMDFHALRVDGFFLDAGSERVNRVWDLGGPLREQLRGGSSLSSVSSGSISEGGIFTDVEIVELPQRRPVPVEQQTTTTTTTTGSSGDGEILEMQNEKEMEKGNGYDNRNFGGMTPAEGRALRRIFRLRMRKFRAALVEIQQFVDPASGKGKGNTSTQEKDKDTDKETEREGVSGDDHDHDHDGRMVVLAMGFVRPMLDDLVRRVDVLERVMAGTLPVV